MRAAVDKIGQAVLAARKAQKQAKQKCGEDVFDFHCRAAGLPPVVRQFQLRKTTQTPRKDGRDIPNAWRFDFAFVEYKVIVEIDGGIWKRGGGAHSHPLDVKRNMEKRNDAALAGFIVLAFMPEQVKSGKAIALTQQVLTRRGWKARS